MDSDKCPLFTTLTDAGVRYRVWAPRVSDLEVRILSPEGVVLRVIPLHRQGDSFVGFDHLGCAGNLYKFHLNKKDTLPDPTSRWQPVGVHGPSMVIDPANFPWTDGAWRKPHFRDLVIYELHIGTFTPRGTFHSACEKLPHIRDLGANAIELMPICDFAGGRNWGYDGVFLCAPSHAYGSPDELRSFVDAAHGLGIAVFMDVVYNHFGPDGNHLATYIGGYLDEAEKNAWGGAIKYADTAFRPLRNLVVSNPEYWMTEFHIDGFRFDATHAIKDDSKQHILQEMTASIHRLGGYAMAEDPRNDASLVTAEAANGYGFDAVWADDFHHSVRVSNTNENEGYLGDFDGTLTELVDTLQNGWHYRGQRAKSVNNAARGTTCDHIPPERFIHCISNHDQTGNHAFGERLSHRIRPAALRAAETLLCLTPYTPLLFMGQEWSASTPFLFFTDHQPDLGQKIIEGRHREFSYFYEFNTPESLGKVPNPQKYSSFEASKLLWEELKRENHRQVFNLYKTCLHLRARERAFRPLDRSSWQVIKLAIEVGALIFKSAEAEWVVLFDLEGGHRGSLLEHDYFQKKNWQLVLSSNEARFGGTGRCAVDPITLWADFSSPESVVLRTLDRG